MIEVWHQWTCNGCGSTETYPMPNTPLADVRGHLKTGGWQCKTGGLDLFTKVLPEIKLIETMSGVEEDTKYNLYDDKWFAMIPTR